MRRLVAAAVMAAGLPAGAIDPQGHRGVRGLAPENTLAEAVAEAQRLGLSVVPWTVNDAGEIARLATVGVDRIITDYPPDRERQALAAAELRVD